MKQKIAQDAFVEQESRTIIESHLYNKGWDVLYNLEVVVEETPILIEAGINRDNWHIHCQIDPKIIEKLDELVLREGIKVDDPARKILCAAADHEEGHWSICPFDRDYVEDILHGIGSGLIKGGMSAEEATQFIPDIANLFIDYIDNAVQGLDSKEGIDFSEGISLFYLHNVRRNENDLGFSVFVDAQMKVYGKSADNISFSRFQQFKNIFSNNSIPSSFRTMAEEHPNYKTLAKDSLRLCKTMLPAPLAEKAYAQGIDGYDARLVVEELTKRELWGKKAEAFAEVFAPYSRKHCQDGETELQQGQGSEKSKSRQSKNNQKRQGNHKSESNSQSQKKHKHHHGHCSFVRELLEDPESKKDLVARALRKGRQASQAGLPYLTQQEVYEAIYELKAEEIVLKFFNDDNEGEEMPAFDLFYLRNRKLEEEEGITGKMNWGRTLFVPRNSKNELWLHQREVPYQIEEELLPGRKSIEDVLFVVDVSGSMGWSGQPLDGSKYDLSLQAIFGTFKGLEVLGRGAHAKYGLVLFGDATTFSGWEGYYSLDKFKKSIFNGYQGGGTELDAQVMETVFQDNKDRFLTIFISDGDISNPDASDVIKKYLHSGNDVIQFSIQGNTSFSNAIKRDGAIIVPVNNPQHLAGLTLEKVTERYR